jgi:integrase
MMPTREEFMARRGNNNVELKDAFIRLLTAPEKGNKILYDDGDVPGFGLRVTVNGAKSFILDYRTRGGRNRRLTIGGWPVWTATDARRKAHQLRRLIEDGRDPMADAEAERAAWTVWDLADRFVAEHVVRKRPSTQDEYRRMLNAYVRPHFSRHMKVQDVAFEDIDALHRKISKTGATYAANRCIAVLSKMFSLAIKWNMRASNPCKGIEKNTEHTRRRYLSTDELARLVKALAGHPERQTVNILTLLLLTGARSGEVLSARWADIDFAGGIWSKPPSSTKQKQPHEAHLSAPACALLASIRDQQTAKRQVLGEYVFPNGHGGHRVELKNGWASICKAAEIHDLRVHDLRHSFASEVISHGASLALVGALLGHSSPITTARYAHLHADPLKDAVEHVGRVFTAAGNDDAAADVVVQLKPGDRRGR